MNTKIKFLWVVCAVFACTQASWALKVKKFDCKLKESFDGKNYVTHVKFVLSGLDKGPEHAEYEFLSKEAAEEWIPVVTEKAKDQSFSYADTLNDNYSIYGKRAQKQVTVKGKKKWVLDKKKGISSIELFGDGDGVVYAYLGLYKDSDYKKGYFKFKADSREDDYYTTIGCDVEDDNEFKPFER